MNNVYQSPEWEEFKKQTGYAKSFRVDDILVLERPLALGRTMLYSPMVSNLQVSNINLQEFSKQIRTLAQKENAVFFRLELDMPKSSSLNTQYQILEIFKKSFEEMQPENNWVLDIRPSTEQILAGMKQKGRYNIKVAEKNAVYFEFLELNDLDIFYDQYQKTGFRHKVTFRDKQYFEKMLEILGQNGYARVCATFAEINDAKTALSSAILLAYGDEVQYLYGASSEENKNLMAPYLMHWKIIEWAKENGFKKYNFLGVAPDDSDKHPWAGITRFKKQFGGYQYDIVGCYDLVSRPVEYQIFKLAEKIRRK